MFGNTRMRKKISFVFWGNAEFSVIVLEKLMEAGFIPTAVVCAPDKPAGRKKIVTPPPIKSLIIEHKTWNVEILQPQALDQVFVLRALSFMPDVFIVAAYPKIIPAEILNIPRLGTIGVHPSLLPYHRGASPIQTAILNGDTTTGTTLFLLDEKVDHGGIVASSEYPVSSEENYEMLSRKLAELSGDSLIQTLPEFIRGEITPIPQDEFHATYTKKFTADDGFVEWLDLEKAQKDGGEVAIMIGRKIRALNPEPGVWALQDGKRIKLLSARLVGGKLKLRLIQKEGKKPISV